MFLYPRRKYLDLTLNMLFNIFFSSFQNAVVNASTLTRPSIPSFETPQTAAAER